MTTICIDERPCFARFESECTLLEDTYPEGECPFCKPERDVTNGVRYPMRRENDKR